MRIKNDFNKVYIKITPVQEKKVLLTLMMLFNWVLCVVYGIIHEDTPTH